LTDICENIDASIVNTLPCPGIKFFGLAELAIKSNQPHPVTINDRKQIAINDRYDGIAYYRLLSSAAPQPAEWQWGNKLNNIFKSRIRNILVFKVNKLAEEFIYDYVNAIPNWLDLQGYKLVDVENNVSIIADQEAVYKTEFGTGDYEKHILTWNIYAIEYDIDFIKC